MARNTILAAAVAISASIASSAAIAQAPSALDTVKARGALRCGVNQSFAGFSAPDTRGEWRGLDVDACRAVAAAIFGDARAVQFVPLTATQRFVALQSGEVDVLARNATWSLTRNTQLKLSFVATNYHDGQGFMVKRSSGIRSIKDLAGATICVQPGTLTEQNLADQFRRLSIGFRPVVIDGIEQVSQAYFGGRCDAITSDQTQLAAIRSSATTPTDHTILPDTISKEPLSVAVRAGDELWGNVVRWSVYAMMEAEELGLTSRNAADAIASTDPNVQRFVGKTGNLGQTLHLGNEWALNIVRLVGNYAESFERNVAPLGIDRGVNRLWRDGGLLISPPFR